MRVHMDGTSPLPHQVFVFGSNLAGRHGAGAARHAMDALGAVYGVASGFTGKCYAIPTKDEQINTMSIAAIRTYADQLVQDMIDNPQMDFFMTRVGCVLAGHSDSSMAALFKRASRLTNVDWPADWAPYLMESHVNP